MTKIAIPTNGSKGLGDQVAGHFGRCNTYTFLDQFGNFLETIDNRSQHTSGSDLPPELLKKHEAEILLCNELGPSALNLCNKLAIKVYVGQAKTVKQIFQMWKSGKIKKAGADDICQEHKL